MYLSDRVYVVNNIVVLCVNFYSIQTKHAQKVHKILAIIMCKRVYNKFSKYSS